ncbi:MAG: hypothetical protein PHR15_01265 [Atopobiaceae bacterium]|nr:hypothetical protein [Atopobiaceae bacterium]MCH4181269.1 hypothetical protein [Atopobiaceae bacterium]MCH4214799.1 hypothetical protein [Atopobiaceae bacterium]MCI1226158.1 hypothetical protein [Atopobiaceae bacterium]MCI1259592.1 hypothetical protein [Atopobiaceae bacterium]
MSKQGTGLVSSGSGIGCDDLDAHRLEWSLEECPARRGGDAQEADATAS